MIRETSLTSPIRSSPLLSPTAQASTVLHRHVGGPLEYDDIKNFISSFYEYYLMQFGTTILLPIEENNTQKFWNNAMLS